MISLGRTGDVGYNTPTAKKGKLSGSERASSVNGAQQLSGSFTPKRLDFNSPERASNNKIPERRLLLGEELSFRKFFLILSYIGRLVSTHKAVGEYGTL